MNPTENMINENQISRLRRNIFIYLRYWKYFLLAVIIFLFLAHIYLKYTTPLYISNMKILVRNDNDGNQLLTEEAIFNDLGFISDLQNTENEMEILKSSYLMNDVVKQLGLNYITFKKGYVRNVDLYNDGPIKISNWISNIKNTPFTFELFSKKRSNKFQIKYKDKILNGLFGVIMHLPEGDITLERKEKFKDNEINDIIIQINDVDYFSSALASKINAVPVGKRSTIIQLTITDIHPQRSADILNQLLRSYDSRQIEDKNRILKNTLQFLDDRISKLTVEVRDVDNDVQQFKSNNKIIDLSNEGNMIMQQANDYSKELTEITIQEEILSNISNNLKRNSSKFEFVPSNTGLTNLTLNQLLESFNQLLLEREKIRNSLGVSHPSNTIIEQQLANLRFNILENVSFLNKDLQVNKNILLSKESSLSSKLSSLPLRERQLIEIQRQQIIKQNLYNYLLQKREETALRLSVAVPSSRVVETAKKGIKFKPKPYYIWTMAILSGILIPFLLIQLYLFFVDTIRSEDELNSLTNVPLIGSIALSKMKSNIVVTNNNRTPIAEMFRLIRANFQFVGQGINNKVILLTSSISGEGKSFICINFGLTLALAGKKVCLIELDMRKPKFMNYLSFKENDFKGLTEFLINENLNWESIVLTTNVHPLLSCVVCGIVPPNPSELLLSDKLVHLIEKLKDKFDYLILDTPPVGMVSDALLLAKFADSTFYIIRQEKTQKSHIKIINDLSKQNKLPRPYIIFNGIKYNKRGYRYGYGYGYGYGYYNESEIKS